MSEPDPRDPDLDAAYRNTPRDQPPADVDERIRAAARRAVDARPQSAHARAAAERRRLRLARWRVPLSIAATVVLAGTVALMIEDEETRPRYDTPVRTDAYVSPTPSGSNTGQREEAAPAAPKPEAMPATPPEEKNEALSDRALSPPAPRAEQPREQRAREFAPPAPGVRESPAPVPAPAPAPSHVQDEAAKTTPAAPSAAPTPPLGTAAGPPRPEPMKATPPSTSSDADAAPPLRRDRALGERPARAARDAASSAASARSADEWIDAIRRLKTDGLDAEAAAELAEFRDRYPNYPLPPELLR